MARPLDRTLIFHSPLRKTSATESSSEDDSVLAALTHNLTVDERQLWLALLDGASIRYVASKNGLTRAAIYRIVRSTSKQPGGMITKNEWVARSWQARQPLIRS